jgi:hypothetical protein
MDQHYAVAGLTPETEGRLIDGPTRRDKSRLGLRDLMKRQSIDAIQQPPIWRNDIDALAFQPEEHIGLCMVHRRAFRTLLRATPTPRECVEFFNAHQEAFQAAARAKLLRTDVATTRNFHLTSRDVFRQLKN